MRALRAHQAVGRTTTRSNTSAQKIVPLATPRSNARTAAIASVGSGFHGASLSASTAATRVQTRALRLETRAASLGDFTADSIDGKPVKLSQYEGKVCLVVNVASA